MNSIRLFFAGDFCSKPSTSKITVSEELKALVQSCDFKVVNFEVPLKPDNVNLPPQKRERFFQNDDAPGFLKELGFNLFQLANNHAFDWGEKGFNKTKAALGDAAFGAGTYDEAYKVKIVEKDNVRIGFLALTYAAYTGVFDDITNQGGLGSAYINDLKVNHVIMEAKKQVNYLFVLPHDGIEYIDVPMPKTIARYRDFIDYGADGVIGTHPHCPQGWETYKGKPIFYSLGNFLFNSKEDYGYRVWNRPHWYEGICVEMVLSENQISFNVINTKNIDNVSLVIDKDIKRDEHNGELLSFLTNEEKYKEYLQPVSKHLYENKIMPIIDGTFHFKKSSVKRLLKSIAKLLLGKGNTSDLSLCDLMKNDLMNEILVHNSNS